MTDSSTDPIDTLIKAVGPLELLRFCKDWDETERLSSLSQDSWKRHHRDKVEKLSPRRESVRVIHALMIRGPPRCR